MADDYAEQQSMELEALESILMDDMQEVTDDVPSGWHPVGKVYKVAVVPQAEDGAKPDDPPVLAEVVFAHTPTYPDEPPLLKARSLRGLADSDVENLQALMQEQIEANLGIPMVYTLIDAAQQWINDKALALSGPSTDPELLRKQAEAEEEARIAAIRAHGTAVTEENFKAWKAQFEAELALTRSKISDTTTSTIAAGASGAADAGESNKLSGKQWFLQQEALHKEIQEPELEDDEEDGEVGDRSEWSEEEEDFVDESSDDEDFLDEFLEGKAVES